MQYNQLNNFFFIVPPSTFLSLNFVDNAPIT